MRQILWYLFAGTRGGPTRARIVARLHDTPMNHHQLAKELGLDYKTVQHHIRILERHRVVKPVPERGYGATYFLTEEFLPFYDEMGMLWDRFGKK